MHITLLLYWYLTHQKIFFDNLLIFMQLSKYFRRNSTFWLQFCFCKIFAFWLVSPLPKKNNSFWGPHKNRGPSKFANSVIRGLGHPCSEWRGYLTTPKKYMSTTILKKIKLFYTFFHLFSTFCKHAGLGGYILYRIMRFGVIFSLLEVFFCRKINYICNYIFYYNNEKIIFQNNHFIKNLNMILKRSKNGN